MVELIALLSIYYKCTALAVDDKLTQSERFACNNAYQEAKRIFVHDSLDSEETRLTAQQNILAYRRFKSWEFENADLVRELRAAE
ncbi:hypothetical protein [Ruegeria lacuscaerulensis]|uniref:hypothetical protein n=1 Tax=Ruegeria lacuscaerulensis TaxID=55218 RepID=UPI0014800863|nr:hypothetical protein [Ruegeria lacuscaerulensis]